MGIADLVTPAGAGAALPFQAGTAMRAVVKLAPATFTDPVFVVLPDVSQTDLVGPCKWAADKGTTRPAVGASALVVWDNTGQPVVVWWDGVPAGVVLTTDTRLTDARTPTGSAGGALAGTYPSPTLAAPAVVDTNGNANGKHYLASGPTSGGVAGTRLQRRVWVYDNHSNAAGASPVMFYVARDTANWSSGGAIRVRPNLAYYLPGYTEYLCTYGYNSVSPFLTLLHTVASGMTVTATAETVITGNKKYVGYYVAVPAYGVAVVEVEFLAGGTYGWQEITGGAAALNAAGQITFVN